VSTGTALSAGSGAKQAFPVGLDSCAESGLLGGCRYRRAAPMWPSVDVGGVVPVPSAQPA